MGKFDKERKDAAKEIRANGYACTIVKKGSPVKDPQTLVVTSTPIEIDTFGINSSFATKDIDGTSIKQGDFKVMLSALGSDGQAFAEPKPDDIFSVVGSPDKLIVNVEKEAPDNVAIYYWLQVRG